MYSMSKLENVTYDKPLKGQLSPYTPYTSSMKQIVLT